jgi:hypothetical protein
MILKKTQMIEIKQVNLTALGGAPKNAGGEYEGNLHYVIENK